MFEEILRNSEEISKKIWEIFLPGGFHLKGDLREGWIANWIQ